MTVNQAVCELLWVYIHLTGKPQEAVYMATAALQEKKNANKWIPVSERLPDPKKDVVVWTIQGNNPRYFVAALFPYKTDGYVWIGEEEIHLYPEQVLYWMPLPKPYEEVDG